LRGRVSSATGHWLLGSAVVILTILAFGAFVLPGDGGSDQAGEVRITDAPPAAPPGGSAISVEAGMAPIPIAPTRENGKRAEAGTLLVAYEKRDRSWAARSETAIQTLMRGIPYVGGSHYLKIKCAASACEVSGVADADTATGSMKPVWEALEHDTAGAQLRAQGLERTAAIFDTGRSGDEFRIYYRRAVPGSRE